MSLEKVDLSRIVRTIWETQLGLELDETEAESIEPGSDRIQTVEIGLEGDFNGRLQQQCSNRLSLDAARAAFAAGDQELGAHDIRDTLTELAQMTAGNLKSLLPGRSTVAVHDHREATDADEQEMARASFRFQDEWLIVTLFRDPSEA